MTASRLALARERLAPVAPIAVISALLAGHPGWGRFTRGAITALAAALMVVWAARMAHWLPWV